MAALTRRQFLATSVAAAAAATLPTAARSDAMQQRGLIKFLEPLPVPGNGIVVATPSAANTYAFTMRQIERQLHPQLPPTPLWAYDDGSGLSGQAGSFGMALVAQRGVPLTVDYVNQLPRTYPAWLPVDTRLTPRGREVRTMTHLHGAFVPADSDGSPAVHPDGFGSGETQTVRYPNDQHAAMLWFHDHGLGATRLNVAAGLAAGYLLRDSDDTGGETNPIGLPGGRYEIPLVIQDRSFNADGTLRYPSSGDEDEPWVGEYFGDVMLVNGKVWPYLDVEPRMYRFRVLNGCNARILTLELDGMRMWQIGSEGGLWDRPVPIRTVVLAPAERADLLVDFGALSGATLALRNHRAMRPTSTPAPQLRDVLRLRVGHHVSEPGPSAVPRRIPGRAALLPPAERTRFITLNEVGAETPAWYLNLNGVRFCEPGVPITATENPQAGTVEDWVFVNLTEDTHPMHMHLVTFQVVGRTPFDAAAYRTDHGGPSGVLGGVDPSPYITGPPEPARITERGFKDTVQADPGYLTRIRARFELPAAITTPQRYVYHCHIVEHEDNDMMRPFTVMP
jgi:spore coat protein A